MHLLNYFRSIENWIIIFLYLLFFSAPISIATGETAIIGLYLVTLIIFYTKNERWKKSILIYGMILFLFGAFISALVSNDLIKSFLYFKKFWRFALPFVLPVVLAGRDINKFLKVLFLVSLVISVLAIVQYFTGLGYYRSFDDPYPKYGDVWHALGTFSFHLTFGGVYLIIFPICISPCLSRQFSTAERIYYGIAGMLIGLAAFLSLGRSIWLGGIVSFCVLFILKKPKFGSFFPLAILLICFYLISAGVNHIKMFKIADTSLGKRFISSINVSTNLDRIYMWKAGLRTISDHFIFGIGPGMNHEMKEVYEQIERETGHKFQHEPSTGVHNIYLQIWINFGILGLLGYLLLWIGFIVAGFYTLKRNLVKDHKNAVFLLGILAGLTGSMAAGFFENNFFDGEVQIVIFLFMGTGVALISELRRLKTSRF